MEPFHGTHQGLTLPIKLAAGEQTIQKYPVGAAAWVEGLFVVKKYSGSPKLISKSLLVSLAPN
jgi:hypothetical protein